MRHFLSFQTFSKAEILEMLSLGREIKKALKSGKKHASSAIFSGKTLAMIFEKSSTRTRISFEVGAYQLGGHALFLSSKDIQLGRGEPLKDTARVVGAMADMVMIRTFGHERLEEFARFCPVPLINGLSDSFHPVQLMADYMTMSECGIGVENEERKPVVAYIGDGNNMANSWIELAALLDFELRVASPTGYLPDASVISWARDLGARLSISQDVRGALKGANVITTDTWASMGHEEQKAERARAFQGYCVDAEAMALGDNAIFLHCLPAYRGQEVTDEVMESPASRVFEEAENRLHAQKGIMVWLMEKFLA